MFNKQKMMMTLDGWK